MAEHTIQLDEILAIANVEGLHGVLEAALGQDEAIAINAGTVKRVDTSTLQALLAFRRAALKQGLACRWSAVSEPLAKAAILLGVEAELAVSES